MKGRLAAVLELGKPRIALLVSLSAFAGHVLARGSVSPGALWVFLGTLVLAAGSAALNQVQERDLDARMARTRHRPLPSGRVSLPWARGAALAWLGVGWGLLWTLAGPTAAGLGALAALWYNGIYTPLKCRSRFAAVPGAVIGALPPAIGWSAAGGSLTDPRLLALSAFLFLWQVPHFWILLLIHGEDYAEAGLPNLAGALGPQGLGRITFVWTAATAASALLLPLFGLVRLLPAYLLLLGGAAYLCARAARLAGGVPPEPPILRRLALQLNGFALLTLAAALWGAGGAA